jgi:hypothetical protein
VAGISTPGFASFVARIFFLSSLFLCRRAGLWLVMQSRPNLQDRRIRPLELDRARNLRSRPGVSRLFRRLPFIRALL